MARKASVTELAVALVLAAVWGIIGYHSGELGRGVGQLHTTHPTPQAVGNVPQWLSAPTEWLLGRPGKAVKDGFAHARGDLPTIIVTVLTTKKYHATRLRDVMTTWGKHVTMPFITSDEADAEYPAVVALGGAKDLAGKCMAAMHRFCNHSGDYYMLSDDDGFLVHHNLERLLAARFSADEDLFGGYSLNHMKPTIIGGGAGILFSRKTMRTFCDAARLGPFPDACRARNPEAGDTRVAYCMDALGIKATHIHGFSPFPLSSLVMIRDICPNTPWIPKYHQCDPPFPVTLSHHYVRNFPETYALQYKFSIPQRRHISARNESIVVTVESE